MSPMSEDFDACYRAVQGRDRRFDGIFYTAVRTTGIYCRPSCPARTPAPTNVSFHPSAASAHQAGYRACKRCLPDATPGSPDWDRAGDVAGRVMRLINDGLVEREGIEGLAIKVAYSTRQLDRIMNEAMGAGPLALARSRRVQLARTLLESTPMPISDVAFASGFASLRQFNATVQEVYAATPTQLRGRGARAASGKIRVRIGAREPFDGQRMLQFLADRAVAGVEHVGDEIYERTLSLPHGPGVVAVHLGGATSAVSCDLTLADARDVAPAVERTRRLLDADADPAAITAHLGADPHLGPIVRAHPGLRVPGHVDGWEAAVRAVLGQQVTVVGARRLAELFVARRGQDLNLASDHQVSRLFPGPEAFLDIDGESWSMPGARVKALQALASAVVAGSVVLDRSADRADVREAILAVPGIGPWTASYVAMRALGDPDVFLPTDVGVRRGAERLGLAAAPSEIEKAASAWRPWRSYALMYLWNLENLAPPEVEEQMK